jgi:hypothetical protein
LASAFVLEPLDQLPERRATAHGTTGPPARDVSAAFTVAGTACSTGPMRLHHRPVVDRNRDQLHHDAELNRRLPIA